MHFPPSFYRIAAACSVASAITTLLLIFLPQFYAEAQGFEGRMARVNDPAYELRAWVYLLHPFFVVTAALGVAMRLRRSVAALIIPGLIGFLLWGATEAAQQALTLAAFDKWRVAWLAGDEAMRASMELRAALYDGLWDATYFLLLIGFLIGNALYAIAMARGRGLTLVVAWLFAAAALLTFTILLGEFGGPTLPGWLGFWIYPLIQPAARVLIGVWLWRHADEAAADPLAQTAAPRQTPVGSR